MEPLTGRHRPAFTLIELLVVVVIVLIATALLLPGLSVAREASRRVQCQENLRRTGVALQTFADSHDRAFPPSRFNTPHHHGWVPMILPFLGTDLPHEQYNWGVNFYDAENESLVSKPLRVLQCPSVPDNPRPFTITDVTGAISYGPGAPSDYFAVSVVFDPSYGIESRRRGVFRNNVVTPIAEITDGTAYTLLVSEAAGRPAAWCRGRKVDDINQVNTRWWGSWAAYNSYGLQGYGSQCTQERGSCAVNCSNGRGIYAFHPGGANVLLADGSVRFLNENLELLIMYALVTKAGQELLALQDFEDASPATVPGQ